MHVNIFNIIYLSDSWRAEAAEHERGRVRIPGGHGVRQGNGAPHHLPPITDLKKINPQLE
jgi:hypothetical protein